MPAPASPSAAVVEVDHEAVGHLRQGVDDRVELGVPMRTPPRLSVASERPPMTHQPRSVMVIQSPWRQTPGKASK